MAVPSAATVYTGQSGGRGDNSGGAAVLDAQPDFLPYAQNIFNAKRQQDAEKARLDRENGKKLQAMLAGPDLGKIPLRAQEEIAKGLKGYQDLAVQMGSGKVTGTGGRRLDPLDPYDLEAQRMLKEKEFELVNLGEAARKQEEALAAIVSASKDPKYDKGYLAKKLEELNSAPDIKGRQKWFESNPLKVNRTTLDIVHDMAPKLMTAIQETGGKTTLTEALNPENIGILVDDYLSTQEGVEDFEAGVADGRWATEEEMKQKVFQVATAQNPGKKSVTYDEPRASSGGSGGSSGGVKPVAAADPSVSPAGKDGQTNIVTFKWGTQAPPTVTLTNDTGEGELVKIVDARQTPDGSSWVVTAETDVEEEQPFTAAEQKAIEEGYEIEPKVKTVKRVKSFPLDVRPGSTGHENYQVLSQIAGADFQTFLGQQGTGQKKSESAEERAARILSGK